MSRAQSTPAGGHSLGLLASCLLSNTLKSTILFHVTSATEKSYILRSIVFWVAVYMMPLSI